MKRKCEERRSDVCTLICCNAKDFCSSTVEINTFYHYAQIHFISQIHIRTYENVNVDYVFPKFLAIVDFLFSIG